MTVRLSILDQSPIVSGAPAADAYVVDELMVVTITGDYASRMRPYELLAAEFGLDPAARSSA